MSTVDMDWTGIGSGQHRFGITQMFLTSMSTLLGLTELTFSTAYREVIPVGDLFRVMS
jgi:hypothetical protein